MLVPLSRLFLIVALAASLPACDRRASETAEANASMPLGSVITSERVALSLGRDWHRGSESDWVFRGVAFLHLAVLEQLTEPIEIEMSGHARTGGYRFEVRLDGEPLYPEPVAIPSSGFVLRLEPESIPPGFHEIRLRRTYRRADTEGGALSHDNELDGLRWGLGAERKLLEPERLAHLRQLDDFLVHGLAGGGVEKRGGLLFVGSQTETIEVGRGPGRELSSVAENLSASPARFAMRLASVGGEGGAEESRTIAPGESAELVLKLGVDAGSVQLQTSGDEDGLFLWGAPFVRESAASDSAGLSAATPVVLITLDTTRRDALSPYGAPPEWTPNLDRFAQGATVYQNAYSTAPWTLPSHASMFTGLYPSAHGAGVRDVRISAAYPTLAEELTRAGYFTAGIAGGDLASHRFGLGRGFRTYRNPDRFETRGDRVTLYARSALEEWGDQPLFLFVNYFDPHGPYSAPRELEERFEVDRLARAAAGQEVWEALARGDAAGWRPVARSEAPATPEGLAVLRALYQAEVAFMDAQLGHLLSALEDVGLYSRAIIAVVADHGELLGEYGLFGHSGRLDTELTWVPMIIKFPHQREPIRVREPVSAVDLFPTLLLAAGVEPPASRGLGLTLDSPSPAPARSRYVFSEEHNARVHPLNPRLRLADHVFAIQSASFRRTVYEGGAECQVLEGDHWRTAACDGDPAALLRGVTASLGVRESDDGELAGLLSPEVEESLRALGYVD